MIDITKIKMNKIDYSKMLSDIRTDIFTEYNDHILSAETYEHYKRIKSLKSKNGHESTTVRFNIFTVFRRINYMCEHAILLNGNAKRWIIDELNTVYTYIQIIYKSRNNSGNSRYDIELIEDAYNLMIIVDNLCNYYEYVYGNKQINEEYKLKAINQKLKKIISCKKKIKNLGMCVSIEFVYYYLVGNMYLDKCIMNIAKLEEEIVYATMAATSFEYMAILSAEFETDIKLWNEYIYLSSIKAAQIIYERIRYVKENETNSFKYLKEDCLEVMQQEIFEYEDYQGKDYICVKSTGNLKKMFDNATDMNMIMSNLQKDMFLYYEIMLGNFEEAKIALKQRNKIYPKIIENKCHVEQARILLEYIEFCKWAQEQNNESSQPCYIEKTKEFILQNIKIVEKEFAERRKLAYIVEDKHKDEEWIDNLFDQLIEQSY